MKYIAGHAICEFGTGGNEEMNHSKLLCNPFSLALALSAVCILLPSTARAQAACVPVNISPPADPALSVFEVEGKITSYDRVSRTITANGMTLTIPSALLIETRNADLGGNITFDSLTDPTLEAQRSIIGGTAIALGNIVFTPISPGYCISFTPTSVYVELAENVVAGLLSDVDPVAGSFRVNGVLVTMNTDPRFPGDILDIGGNPITVADLVGFEGTEVSAGGYFDATQGMLLGTLIETEALLSQPGSDGVAITRARGDTDDNEIRVEGINTPSPQTGQYAPSVTVHAGGLDAAGTGCAGAQLGTAAVSAADGTWSLRLRNAPQVPAEVCAKSPLGGVATRLVEVDN